MKVCTMCGVEIYGMDGVNMCNSCKCNAKKQKAKLARKERDSIMRSMGLTKVKGALGGTYWE